jgi:hypothetical protein
VGANGQRSSGLRRPCSGAGIAISTNIYSEQSRFLPLSSARRHPPLLSFASYPDDSRSGALPCPSPPSQPNPVVESIPPHPNPISRLDSSRWHRLQFSLTPAPPASLDPGDQRSTSPCLAVTGSGAGGLVPVGPARTQDLEDAGPRDEGPGQ